MAIDQKVKDVTVIRLFGQNILKQRHGLADTSEG